MSQGKPAQTGPDSFVTRVKESLPELHPMEKQLADFILDFPGELASYTASELASLASVSNATVSRFIRRLGYQNFDEARRHVREEQQSGSALFLTGRSAPSCGAMLELHSQAGQENISRTFNRISEESINAIVDKMLSARKVWVAGFRASQSLAAYFQWQLYQLNDEARLIPANDGSLGEHVSAIKAEDLVVLFGLRRRPHIWRALLQQCIASGAAIVLITDDNMAFDKEVTWHLPCCCDNSAGPLDNHVAAMALSHVLLNLAFERSGPDQRRRLADSDLQHQLLDEL